VYRYVATIDNPNDADYINALNDDPTLTKGDERNLCLYNADAAAKVALHNLKDAAGVIS